MGRDLSQGQRNWKVNNDQIYTEQKEAKAQDGLT
jgi:hypothetical protein